MNKFEKLDVKELIDFVLTQNNVTVEEGDIDNLMFSYGLTYNCVALFEVREK